MCKSIHNNAASQLTLGHTQELGVPVLDEAGMLALLQHAGGTAAKEEGAD